MKFNLGSKLSPPTGMAQSRTWYPTVTLKHKSADGYKVGQKIEGMVEGEVMGVRKDPDTGEFLCEVEVHSLDTKKEPSNMEKAGY